MQLRKGCLFLDHVRDGKNSRLNRARLICMQIHYWNFDSFLLNEVYIETLFHEHWTNWISFQKAFWPSEVIISFNNGYPFLGEGWKTSSPKNACVGGYTFHDLFVSLPEITECAYHQNSSGDFLTAFIACVQTVTKLWLVNQSLISSARRLLS